MKIYRLLNIALNNYETFTKEVCERVGDGIVCRFITENIPEAGELISFSLEEEKIDNHKIVEIIKKRKAVIKKFPSLSVGSPNYLPFSFLQGALRCSAAVCLIKNKYEIEDIIKRIKNTNTKAFPSILDVISDELDLDEKFWEPYTTVSEAIEDENFQNQMKDKEKNTVWVPIGTGFLVGRNYLLTNHHVLPNKAEAKSCIVQFKYEKDEFGRDRKPRIEYYLDPSFFKTSPESELDYTIVKLHPFSFDKSTEPEKKQKRNEFNLAFEEAGDNFGWLPMLKDDDLISPPLNLEDSEIFNRLSEDLQKSAIKLGGFAGESVNIIQHPRGRQKEIVISDNRVQSIYKNFIQYTTDTDFGSSGSPVFNNRWQLVALHHGMLVEYKDDDVEKSLEKKVIVGGNLGVRINQIVAHLEKQEDTETRKFLDDFVNQQPTIKRKIYILAGRERRRFKDEMIKEAELTNYIGEKIGELLENPETLKKIFNKLSSTNQSIENFNYNFQPEYVPQENRKYLRGEDTTTLDKSISWIQQETNKQVIENNYQLGDVAIEIVTNYYYQNTNDLKPNEVGGATVYYVNLPNYKDGRKSDAKTLLTSLLNNVNNLPPVPPDLNDRGTQPDTAVRNQGLRFCRDVIIPSLVLYVGYWTNPKERQLLENRKDEIAEGIVKGIVEWSNSLSPWINQAS